MSPDGACSETTVKQGVYVDLPPTSAAESAVDDLDWWLFWCPVELSDHAADAIRRIVEVDTPDA